MMIEDMMITGILLNNLLEILSYILTLETPSIAASPYNYPSMVCLHCFELEFVVFVLLLLLLCFFVVLEFTRSSFYVVLFQFYICTPSDGFSSTLEAIVQKCSPEC
jgi:hypothetical protein